MIKFIIALLFLFSLHLIVAQEFQEDADVTISSASTFEYIIVGAGTAGISAARNYKNNGKDNFVVLEARNRIGGRVFTNYDDLPEGFDEPFEEGAWWLQQSNINTLDDYADQNGIVTQLFVQGDVWIYENGVKLKKSEVDALVAQWATAWANAIPFFMLGRSSAEALQLGGYTTVVPRVELAFAFLDEQIYGDNLEYHDSTGSEGTENAGSDYLVTNGYNQIHQHLIHNPTSFASQIKMNREVYKINSARSDGQVYVYYRDLTTNQKFRLTATKAVIVTAPLGVLRSRLIQFTPPLPAPHQFSIDNLLCSMVNKVALYFDPVQGRQFLKRFRTNYLLRVPRGNNPRFNDGIMVFFNDQYVRGQPALYSYYQGDFARNAEQLTDQQIVDITMQVLRQDIDSAFPNPIAHIVTRWGQEKYTECVYTDIAKGTTLQNLANLLIPFGAKSNVYLAGEHACLNDQGYVHTAFSSGFNQSQASLALM